MLMCLCYGVSCNEIKSLICQGVVTKEGIQELSLAGTGCGCCLEALEGFIANECCHTANMTQLKISHVIAEQDNSQIQYP